MAMVFIQGASGGKPEEEKTVVLELQDGDQEVTPSDGKTLCKVTIEKPTMLIPENVKNGITIAGVTGTLESEGSENDLAGLVDGSLTSFTMPAGKTVIAAYKFYQMNWLVSLDLKNCEVIESYAFRGCGRLENLVLPHSVKSIGDHAFNQISYKSNSKFELNLSNECSIGNYAFYNTPITSLSGTIGTIGDQAFDACKSLTTVDIECKGIGEYAFCDDDNLNSIKLKN